MLLIKIAALWIQSRILRSRAARWDYLYINGKLEKLKMEQLRISATAALVARHVPRGWVLEIGCGEALHHPQVNSGDQLSWIGVDISEVAIRRAQAFATEKVRYIVADMETLDPGVKFDAILFAESIYYATDCAQLLQRYSRFLNLGGVFIVSICRGKSSDKIWADIHSVTTTLDAIVTIGESKTWDCEVLGAS